MSGRAPIASLTGLRFYAAALIVHTHTIYFNLNSLPQLINDSYRIDHLGMTLFFVLSGFVIYYNYGESIATRKPGAVRSFAVARFSRLWPLYLFGLALDLALRAPQPFTSDGFWAVWPFFLTLTQNWFPIKIGDKLLVDMYIGGAWSLSTEILLYLSFLLLVWPIHRLRSERDIVIAIGVLFIAATIFYLGHAFDLWLAYVPSYWGFYQSPYARLPEFTLGALTAAAIMATQRREATTAEQCAGKVILCASLVWIVALFLLCYVPSVTRSADLFQLSWGYAPPCAGLIYCFARFRTPLSWAVENKLVIALGEASYSMYLLHAFVIFLFSRGPVEGWPLVFRIAVTTPLIAILSLGAYAYIEVPARRFLRRILDVRRPAPSAAA